MKIQLLNPGLDTGPGEVTSARLAVQLDGVGGGHFAVRVHGLSATDGFTELPAPPRGNGTVQLAVPIHVPADCAEGDHVIALELRHHTAAGSQSAIVETSVHVGRSEGLAVRVTPDVIRGSGWTRFDVEVSNSRIHPEVVRLSALGPELRVQLRRHQVLVPPAETVSVRGRVRAGAAHADVQRHPLTVSATANSRPVYAHAVFEQRAVIAPKLRSGLAFLGILAVWAMILGGGLLWWNSGRDDLSGHLADSALVGPDGTAVAAGDSASGANGSGSGSSDQSPGAQPGTPGQPGSGDTPGSGDQPGAAALAGRGSTIVRGTVTDASAGVARDVVISLTPLAAADTTPASNPLASGWKRPAKQSASSSTDPATKRWPARHGSYSAGQATKVRTISVSSASSLADGTWSFSGIPLSRSFEISFAKPGYQTQSHVVTTGADGKPVTLDVTLQPGDGSLSGWVGGPNGGVGGATVTITDGTVTMHTSTSTMPGHIGEWSMDHLPTPGTYTITISKDGMGTEVIQRRLTPGGRATGVNVSLHAGVGSIGGMITDRDGPLPGATVSVAGAETTMTSTSLSEGAVGTYNLPRLPIGTTYTISVSAPGYLSQSRSVTVTQANPNVSGINFSLTATTGTIVGRVMGLATGTDTPQPLVSAGVTISGGGLEVRTQSAAAPDAGAFSVTELPPGSYLVTAVRYDHAPVSMMVTLGAGAVVDVGDLILDYRPIAQLNPTGSVTVEIVDLFGEPLSGATVDLVDVGGRLPKVTKAAGAESTVTFNNVPIATYRIVASKTDYRSSEYGPQSVGLGPVTRQLRLLKYGSARGTVIDGLGGFTTRPVTSEGEPVLQNAQGTVVYIKALADADLSGIGCYVDTGEPDPAKQCKPPSALYQSAPGPLVAKYPHTAGDVYVRLDDGGKPVDPLIEKRIKVGNQQLENYTLLLYRNVSGAVSCVDAISVAAGTTADDGQKFWSVDSSKALVEGDYELRFTRLANEPAGTPCYGNAKLPRGFGVGSSDPVVARFKISADSDRAIIVDPIELAPYPSLTGDVLIPTLDGSGAVTFDGLPAAQQSGLAMTLKCADKPAVILTLTADPASDNTKFGLTRGVVWDQLLGTAVGSAGQLASCTLRSTMNGRIDVTYDVTWPKLPQLTAGTWNPTTYPQLNLAVAMVKDPGTVTGRVLWRDLGAEGAENPTPLYGGGNVASADVVTTGYQPGSPAPTPTEAAVLAQIQNGNFALAPKQVIGSEQYSFNPTGMAGTTVVKIEADGTNPWKVTDPADPSDAWDVVGSAPNQTLDVYVQPAPGKIRIPVQLYSAANNVSTKATPDLTVTPKMSQDACTVSGVRIDRVVPITSVPYYVNPFDSTAEVYEIPNACAGTWAVDFKPAADSDYYIHAGRDAQRVRVGPAGVATTQTVKIVDLARVDVALMDMQDVPIKGSEGFTFSLAPGGTSPGATWWPTTPQTVADKVPDQAGKLTFPKLAVDGYFQAYNYYTFSREYRSASYILRLNPPAGISNADLTGAQIDIEDASGTSVYNAAGQTDLSNIVLNVLPGTDLKVTVKIPAKATIEGHLKGRDSPPSAGINPVPLSVGPLSDPVDPPYDPGQVVLSKADANGAPGTPTFDAPRSYSGYYAFTVARGDYFLQGTAPPVVDGDWQPYVNSPQISVSAPDANQTYSRDVVLECATVPLKISAKDRPTSVNPDDPVPSDVADVAVQMWWGSVSPAKHPTTGEWELSGRADGVAGDYTATTTADGTASVNACPGTYTVLMTKRNSLGEDVNFPVLVEVYLQQTAVDKTIEAIMPELTGSITGEVQFQNQNGNPVAAPTDSVTIERTYTAYDPKVNGGSKDNKADTAGVGPNIHGQVDAAEQDDDSWTYGFNDLAFGKHTLAPQDVSGFTAPAAFDVWVSGVTPAAVTTYKATNRTVTLTVKHGTTPITGATVTLTGAHLGATALSATEGSDGAYTITGVPPDLVDYVVNVTLAGYVNPQMDLNVAPGVDSLVADVPVKAQPKLSGTIYDCNSATACATGAAKVGLAGATVELLDAAEAAVALTSTTTDSNGVYSFVRESTDTGPFWIRVSKTGYVTTTSATSQTLVVDQVKEIDLDLNKMATVTWTGVPTGVTVAPATGAALTPGPVSFTATGANYQELTYSANFGPGEDKPIAFADAFPYAKLTVTLDGAPSGVTADIVDADATVFDNVAAGEYHVKSGRTYSVTGAGGTNVQSQSQSATPTTAAPAAVTLSWGKLTVAFSGAPSGVKADIVDADATVFDNVAAGEYHVKSGRTYSVTGAGGTNVQLQSQSVTPTAADPKTVTFTWAMINVTLDGAPTGVAVGITDVFSPAAVSGTTARFYVKPDVTYTVTAEGPNAFAQSATTTPTASTAGEVTFRWTARAFTASAPGNDWSGEIKICVAGPPTNCVSGQVSKGNNTNSMTAYLSVGNFDATATLGSANLTAPAKVVTATYNAGWTVTITKTDGTADGTYTFTFTAP